MTYGTLFSGVEGFGQGFDRAGMRCLWQCEVDKVCQRVLRRHYPDVTLFDDVRTLDPYAVSVPDVVAWGSPCQDLSVSGSRSGLGGHKSGLFYEGIRVVSALFRRGTRYSVWENVLGAFSTHGGEDFRCVLEAFVEACSGECVPVPRPKKWFKAGCILGDGWSVAWRVLDAQHFGVPQRRKRVFVVADSRGCSAPEILLEREGGRGYDPARKDQGKNHPAELDECPDGVGMFQYKSGRNGYDLTVAALTVETDLTARVVCRAVEGQPKHSLYDSFGMGLGGPNDVCQTLRATHMGTGGVNNPLVVDASSIAREPYANDPECGIYQWASGGGDELKDTAQSLRANAEASYQVVFTQHADGSGSPSHSANSEVYAFRRRDGATFGPMQVSNTCESHWGTGGNNVPLVAGALNASMSKGKNGQDCASLIPDGPTVRRLTPVECCRLMGWPDDWNEWGIDEKGNKVKISDSQRYKQCGNGVVANVAEWIALRLIGGQP